MGRLSYPFFQNHYYNGKLLQAEDFQREQEFYDNKFRFVNAWTFGYGIIEGLRVQKVDGESILLEPGCCVDGEGRLIVVDSPSIFRLGTLDGFEKLQGDIALLRVYFKQESVGEEFCALGESRREPSTKKEGYRLSLEPPDGEEAEEPLLSNTVLYQDQELCVTQRIPRILWGEGATQVTLRFENRSTAELQVAFRYSLDTPGFFCGETGGIACLEEEVLLLPSGRTERSISLLQRRESVSKSVIFRCPKEGFFLKKQGGVFSSQIGFQEEFQVEQGPIREAVLNRLRARPLEDAWSGGSMIGVSVAVLRLIRMDRHLLLDEVLPVLPEWYACHPALLHQSRRLLSAYRKPDVAFTPQVEQTVFPGLTEEQEERMGKIAGEESRREAFQTFRTGVVRLEAGLNYRPGTVLFSEEIVHGLGPGSVFLEFGREEVFLDQDRSRNKSEVILGEEALFEQLRGKDAVSLEKAVKIYPDKGSFQLAVRSPKRISTPTLCLRWFAFRMPGERSGERPAKGGTLKRLSPDVVSLLPKAAVSFVPIFEDGETEPCDFFLAKGEKGYISENGIYTAPEEEGLYVITACVHSRPKERVSAFVLVKAEGGTP